MENYTELYGGGTYDRLGEESRLLTAYCWYLNLGEEAQNNLVEGLRSLNLSSAADAAEENGVNYFVIAPGDSDPYSGYLYPEIDVTTGEWYLDFPPSVQEEISSLEESVSSAVWELLADFSKAVVDAVVESAKGVSPKE